MKLNDYRSVRRVFEHEGQEVETMEAAPGRPGRGISLGNEIEGGICASFYRKLGSAHISDIINNLK